MPAFIGDGSESNLMGLYVLKLVLCVFMFVSLFHFFSLMFDVVGRGYALLQPWLKGIQIVLS